MAGSAKKIFDAAAGAPEGHSVVLLAHNGPTGLCTFHEHHESHKQNVSHLSILIKNYVTHFAGLGSRMDDICGRDWVPGAGDHGDPGLMFMITLPL